MLTNIVYITKMLLLWKLEYILKYINIKIDKIFSLEPGEYGGLFHMVDWLPTLLNRSSFCWLKGTVSENYNAWSFIPLVGFQFYLWTYLGRLFRTDFDCILFRGGVKEPAGLDGVDQGPAIWQNAGRTRAMQQSGTVCLAPERRIYLNNVRKD